MTLTNGGRRNVPFTGGVGGHGFFPSAIPERYRPGAWPSQGRGHRGGVCTAGRGPRLRACVHALSQSRGGVASRGLPAGSPRGRGSRPSAKIQAVTSSMRVRLVGLVRAPAAAWCSLSSSGSRAAGNDQVVPDDGGMNAHELRDAFPAQPDQHPFRVRSAPQPPVHNGHHPATATPGQ